MIESVDSGRCGPCSSIALIGIKAISVLATAASNSGNVMSIIVWYFIFGSKTVKKRIIATKGTKRHEVKNSFQFWVLSFQARREAIIENRKLKIVSPSCLFVSFVASLS